LGGEELGTKKMQTLVSLFLPYIRAPFSAESIQETEEDEGGKKYIFHLLQLTTWGEREGCLGKCEAE
jgi:hypothetical protein